MLNVRKSSRLTLTFLSLPNSSAMPRTSYRAWNVRVETDDLMRRIERKIILQTPDLTRVNRLDLLNEAIKLLATAYEVR